MNISKHKGEDMVLAMQIQEEIEVVVEEPRSVFKSIANFLALTHLVEIGFYVNDIRIATLHVVRVWGRGGEDAVDGYFDIKESQNKSDLLTVAKETWNWDHFFPKNIHWELPFRSPL